ncbi:MAG: RnfABCDGE type electron transport complex subunit B [Gammaproteobacteria bacterium]|nr:RnfABCDGE type electron transport complex subunit B [Gammaproteobacteria bacterium]
MLIGAHEIHALLPHTQCTRCGFTGCQPYAEAIADNTAAINRCPPGGAETIKALARLLNRKVLALEPECGIEQESMVAVIDHELCIGCARCLPPCPVDAIVGATRQMHTVINNLCTGCELCIAPCPVDCISLAPRANLGADSHRPSSLKNLERYTIHTMRHTRREQDQLSLLNERKLLATSKSSP